MVSKIPNNLKVLQYNICYWCMDPKSYDNKKLAQKCYNNGGINRCKDNIINLILHGNYDLISLIECGSYNANMILNMLNNRYNNSYSLILERYKSSGSYGVIIYKNLYIKPIENPIYGDASFVSGDNRPYIFQKFTLTGKKFIFGSFWGPHGVKNDNWFSQKITEILSNFSLSDTPIIIAGDFNYELLNKLNIGQTNLQPLNTNWNTCCNESKVNNYDKYNSSYKYKSDNILISPNVFVRFGPEYLGDGQNNFFPKNNQGKFRYHTNSSDHLPMAVDLMLVQSSINEKNSDPNNIGFDVDGVLHNNVHFSSNGQGHPAGNHNKPKKNLENHPYLDIIKIMKEYYDNGKTIFICSHNWAFKKDVLINFLKKYGITVSPDNIFAGSIDKAEFIYHNSISVFYDDSPRVLNKIKEMLIDSSKDITSNKLGLYPGRYKLNNLELWQTCPIGSNSPGNCVNLQPIDFYTKRSIKRTNETLDKMQIIVDKVEIIVNNIIVHFKAKKSYKALYNDFLILYNKFMVLYKEIFS